MIRLTLALLGSMAASLATPAMAGQVRYFGETILAYSENDVDHIQVPGACGTVYNPMVTKLKVRMTLGSGEIEALAVEYGNGQLDFLQVREHFARGSESRWIDLNGQRRCVKKIHVIGDTDNNANQRARVSVFGFTP